MPSDKEIEAAAMAICSFWYEGDIFDKYPKERIVGMRKQLTKEAKAALEAAEQSRQDMHTELVEALEGLIDSSVETTPNGKYSIAPASYGAVVRAIDVLDKATKENEIMSIEELKTELIKLTDDERLELFSDYCDSCGCYNQPTARPCQCWNDE